MDTGRPQDTRFAVGAHRDLVRTLCPRWSGASGRPWPSEVGAVGQQVVLLDEPNPAALGVRQPVRDARPWSAGSPSRVWVWLLIQPQHGRRVEVSDRIAHAVPRPDGGQLNTKDVTEQARSSSSSPPAGPVISALARPDVPATGLTGGPPAVPTAVAAPARVSFNPGSVSPSEGNTMTDSSTAGPPRRPAQAPDPGSSLSDFGIDTTSQNNREAVRTSLSRVRRWRRRTAARPARLAILLIIFTSLSSVFFTLNNLANLMSQGAARRSSRWASCRCCCRRDRPVRRHGPPDRRRAGAAPEQGGNLRGRWGTRSSWAS